MDIKFSLKNIIAKDLYTKSTNQGLFNKKARKLYRKKPKA